VPAHNRLRTTSRRHLERRGGEGEGTDSHFLDIDTSWRRMVNFTTHSTHWIGCWVGPGTGERGKLFILPGPKHQPRVRPGYRVWQQGHMKFEPCMSHSTISPKHIELLLRSLFGRCQTVTERPPCDPILLAVCTSTFSRLCRNVYSGM
jgi:hypothetical protein